MLIVGEFRLAGARMLLLCIASVDCILGALRVHLVVMDVHFENLFDLKVVLGAAFATSLCVFVDRLRSAALSARSRFVDDSRGLGSLDRQVHILFL